MISRQERPSENFSKAISNQDSLSIGEPCSSIRHSELFLGSVAELQIIDSQLLSL
jgi:hypothetical protein